MLNHLDLFSGIGGFALSARWTGAIRTVAFVEIDPFCQRVLNKNFPGVPIISDIREVTGERIREIVADTDIGRPQEQGAEQQTGGNRQFLQDNAIDILTGGFPCQPFSAAGKRKGKGDDRYLWPEMLRVIAEVGPTWIIGENVAGLINMAQPDSQPEMGCEADTDIEENADCDARGILGGIIDDLENLGYEIQPFVIPACAVNAPHRRDRVWIVAHSTSGGCFNGGDNGEERHLQNPTIGKIEKNKSERDRWFSGSEQTYRHAPDTGNEGLQGGEWPGAYDQGQTAHGSASQRNSAWDEPWYSVALRTCVRNLDDGVSGRLAGRGRVNKLKALGNSVVPQVVYPIMKAICEIEGCKFE